MAKIRVFVSIPMPNTAGLRPMMDDLSKVRGVRTSPMGQMHITLRFIGDIEEDRVDDIETAVNEAIAGVKASRITLKGLGAFPNQRNPRVLWAGISTEMPLLEISERLSARFKTMNIPFDEKPFRPHITVGRIEGRANLVHEFSRYQTTEFATYIPNSVMVMKSELTPKGAVHSILRVCYFD
ncbi:MAG: RNA 2',3'-cyclic phosphodiesterase [Candidatus Methanomethylophilus sp.]|nr:RNA 2',3'-cyclic phosphodiesterase [Methanomethylophilus sp.]MBO5600153.1 RNA 2',3'-cyclic phosphodiesterase [Methanomethylophilus sp.]